MEALGGLGRLVLVVVFPIGTLLGLALLLNLRDRRQARVLGTVLHELNSRDLRGRTAVRVRCGLLSPRTLVSVYVLSCSRDEIWEIMTRLAQRLSPRIRIEVSGPQDRRFLVTFTLQTTGWRLPVRPPQPSLATG